MNRGTRATKHTDLPALVATVERGETMRQGCLCLYPQSSASPQGPLHSLPHGRQGEPIFASFRGLPMAHWPCEVSFQSQLWFPVTAVTEEASQMLRGVQSFTFCIFVAVHILLFRLRDQVRLGQPSSLLFPVPVSYLKKYVLLIL